jgi:hypothetical protein
VLALFSPRCVGCTYGANALIVWVVMPESDNEHEARIAAQRFDFRGTRHVYYGRRRIGARLMPEQFPKFKNTKERREGYNPN